MVHRVFGFIVSIILTAKRLPPPRTGARRYVFGRQDGRRGVRGGSDRDAAWGVEETSEIPAMPSESARGAYSRRTLSATGEPPRA